jgi:nucleotide-binding universal stress UspA family protein
MFHRLLVPLDGSQLAESVLPSAARFAGAFNAQILLLHVLERNAPAAVHGERHLRTVPEATVYLQEVAAQLREQGVAVDFHAHEAPEGDVARSIVAHADEVQADLIVLCTHGSGGVPELLFGSIAQRVLHRGAAPVLLIRPGLTDSAESPLSAGRVVVPLDGTHAAEMAIEPAAEIAQCLEASLHLVMVVGTRETMKRCGLPTSGLLPSATRAALEIERLDAESYLKDVARSLWTPSLHVTAEVRGGDATSALAEEASEPGVTLVIIATRGRAGLQAVWAGSVAAQLLARTRAPILLLRRIEG